MPLIFFGVITVVPSTGTDGDTITIDNTGAGFFDTMVVTIGGIAADNIAVDTGYGNGQQRITCDVPSGLTPGSTVDIYVENPDGENTTLGGAFTLDAASAGGFTRMPQMAIGAYVGL
jgi:hypothetical protein